MKRFIAAGLCATCWTSLWSQTISPVAPSGSFLLRTYEAPAIPASRLANSGRLGSLVRGNRLYLTAQDAIALALENNIDIESSRYNALIDAYNLRRQEAGGPLPGVPTGASAVGSVASGQGVSGSESSAGVNNSGGPSNGNSTVNATIAQIGSTTPTLDPVFTNVESFSHLSTPQYQTTLSQNVNYIQNERYYTASLQQGLITGGQLTTTYTDSYLNENAPTDVLNPSSSNSAGFSFHHQLLQGFGRALNSRNITIAKTNLAVNDLNFKQEVIAVIVNTVNNYYSLAADYEALRSKQSALSVAQRFYEDNKKQVEIGTLAPLDVTSAEAQVASSQQALVAAEASLAQDQLTLKNLLSRNGLADPILSRVELVPLDRISVPESDDLPPMKQLVTFALANRPDLAADKLNLANSITSALNTTNAVLPGLVVIANASNAGLAGQAKYVPLNLPVIPTTGGTTTIPAGFVTCPAGIGKPGSICEAPNSAFVGGIDTALGQVAGRHFPNESAGAYFSAPFRDRSSLADAAIDQLGIRQTELQNQRSVNQVVVDVSNRYIGLQQARVRYKAAVQNRILEEQLLSAEQKKFALGASTTYNVVQQQRDLAAAQSTEVGSLVAYSQARITLDQTIGSTLKANNVSISEVTSGHVSRLSALPETLPN